MVVKYLVRGSKKQTFSGEYEDFEREVTQDELAQLQDSKVIVNEALRKTIPVESDSD